jgi:hypothetical protein
MQTVPFPSRSRPPSSHYYRASFVVVIVVVVGGVALRISRRP